MSKCIQFSTCRKKRTKHTTTDARINRIYCKRHWVIVNIQIQIKNLQDWKTFLKWSNLIDLSVVHDESRPSLSKTLEWPGLLEFKTWSLYCSFLILAWLNSTPLIFGLILSWYFDEDCGDDDDETDNIPNYVWVGDPQCWLCRLGYSNTMSARPQLLIFNI